MRRCVGLFAAAARPLVSASMLVSRSAGVAPVVLSRSFADFGGSSSSSSSSSDRSPFVPKPIFSSYKIYKTKTALDISVVRAQLGWNSPKVEERRYLSLKKGGGFRLTFAGGENKAYNWEEGQVITLSVTELGDLLAFAQNKEQPEHKIFHDPLLGSDLAGQTRKELVVKRIGAGKPGYFFNFTVTSKDENATGAAAGQRKWSIAVSEGEFQVFLTLVKQTMPDLLAFTTKPQIQTEETSYANRKANATGAAAGEESQQPQQQARKKSWNDAK